MGPEMIWTVRVTCFHNFEPENLQTPSSSNLRIQTPETIRTTRIKSRKPVSRDELFARMRIKRQHRVERTVLVAKEIRRITLLICYLNSLNNSINSPIGYSNQIIYLKFNRDESFRVYHK